MNIEIKSIFERVNIMYIIYWFLKFGWLLLIIFIGNIYLSNFGLWSVVIGVALFLLGNLLINKKMDHYSKQFFLRRFPVLAELESGEIIHIELKNEENLLNKVFISLSNSEILIGKEQFPVVEIDKLLAGRKKTQWIRLKNVKAIKKEESV